MSLSDEERALIVSLEIEKAYRHCTPRWRLPGQSRHTAQLQGGGDEIALHY